MADRLRKIEFNVFAQFAGCAAPLVGNLAQRVPGGVFKKDIIVAVKTVGIVKVAPVRLFWCRAAGPAQN
jgi:hypothetical protein